MKKILIIGCYGFLGQNLYIYLNKLFDVTIAVKSSSLRPKTIHSANKIVFTDSQKFIDTLKNNSFDVIVNCSVEYGRTVNYNYTLKTNYNFPLEIISAIKNSETLFICFDTFYTKFDSYQYLINYIKSKNDFKKKCSSIKNIKIINLQIEHLFGLYDNPKKFVPNIIFHLKNNLELNLTKCFQKRDFIYVDDLSVLIKMLILKFEQIEKKYYHFEIGTGKSIEIREFIDKAKKISKSTSKINYGNIQMRDNEIMDSYASLSSITKFCGWIPTINYDDGLKNIINGSGVV